MTATGRTASSLSDPSGSLTLLPRRLFHNGRTHDEPDLWESSSKTVPLQVQSDQVAFNAIDVALIMTTDGRAIVGTTMGFFQATRVCGTDGDML